MPTSSFHSFKQALAGALRPQRIPFRHLAQRSAVAIISRQGPLGEEILLIERATRNGDPWSGHMAFPGGKQQSSDSSIRNTAIRETKEEIGLDLDIHAHSLGRSAELITRRHNVLKPMIVTPFRFQLNDTSNFDTCDMTANHEVASILWVPVSFLRDKGNLSTLHWSPIPTHHNRPSALAKPNVKRPAQCAGNSHRLTSNTARQGHAVLSLVMIPEIVI